MITIIKVTFIINSKVRSVYEPKLTLNPIFYIQTDNFEIAESLGMNLLQKEHNLEDFYETVMSICTVHTIQ
jgi:hypothetical protein